MASRSVSALAALGALLCLSACGREEPETPPEPFVEDTDDAPLYNTDSTSTTFPADTGFLAALDDEPEHWLHITQLGTWNLSPAGGPYNNLTGMLTVTEIVDVPEDPEDLPECLITYALVGQTYTPHSCPSCDFAVLVEYTATGNPADCHDPDMPASGAQWQMGYDAGADQILFNYYGTGVWVPWYQTTKVGDQITIDWSTDIAITVEEED